MKYTDELQQIIQNAFRLAEEERHRYIMPEHIVYGFTKDRQFNQRFRYYGGDVQQLQEQIVVWLRENAEQLQEEEEQEITDDFRRIFIMAEGQAQSSEREVVEASHLLAAILSLEDSYAVYYLAVQGVDLLELLGDLSRDSISDSVETQRQAEYVTAERPADTMDWRQYTECMNDRCRKENPLIGREEELERTIGILCRMDKNNVLHIGEPGVGKTAIAYGLACRIEAKAVPKPLENARIYSIDMGTLLAGTQYRGDFEKRFQMIMKGIGAEENPIVYLDEIHNIVGAGAVNGGSFDVSNMLKPYLAEGHIRFIGATTYDEYKKHFSGNKSLVRRFQNVEVKEPSEEETTAILKGLKRRYEKFHGVRYGNGVIEYISAVSKKYGNNRFLPDKAIDLMDEAGAFRKLHPLNQKVQTVSKQLIDEILSKNYNIPKQMLEKDDLTRLANLECNLGKRVFGQEEMLAQIGNAVKFSKAGLNEEGKPLASFLFVGPTGVGKTEAAKALAEELGISLVRFDMSEYTEKHAVAKLIGAPAGYVGYEEGGLLTEEIRKHPHAVLLLDEIEKAHPDIYNILLQVMDYATLTDNKGDKTDFRNVILIMTSNAGANQMGKQALGFDGQNRNQEAVEEAVKRIFQPEFRNRLSKIILFHSMDDKMAGRITEKKLTELKEKLAQKKVELHFTKAAVSHIKQSGITPEYGAREIDRVIAGEVKPLLVSELLFGRLKKGGQCTVDEKDGKLFLVFR